LDIFQTQLKDEDSYVYMAAIMGLGALGDIYPREIIPKLSFVYEDRKAKEEVRLKLGETLVQIAQRCGEVLPVYAALLMNTFLVNVKDPNPVIKASSLSNLATMCETLKFAIHPFISELINMIPSLLSSEKETEVRRGILFLLSMLIKGLGNDVWSLIENELKDVYRALKNLEEFDRDDICRVHARVALFELAVIMKQFYSPLFAQPPKFIDVNN